MVLQAVAYRSANLVSYLSNRFGEPVLATGLAINSGHAYAAVKLGQLYRLKVLLERDRTVRRPALSEFQRRDYLDATQMFGALYY